VSAQPRTAGQIPV